MFYMRKIRVYIAASIIMLLTVLLALAVLSSLVYVLKWQSDKAMGGIVIVYILSGFSGGVGYSWIQKRQEKCQLGIGKKAVEALLLSTIFLCILMFISIFLLQIPFMPSGRTLMIWLLLIGSCFLGRIL